MKPSQDTLLRTKSDNRHKQQNRLHIACFVLIMPSFNSFCPSNMLAQ
jgi:hypothetical protein